MLEALEDPGHERHAETLERLGEDFDPHAFDAERLKADVAALAMGKKTCRQKAATCLTRGPHRRVTMISHPSAKG
jgi:hypothetical protein